MLQQCLDGFFRVLNARMLFSESKGFKRGGFQILKGLNVFFFFRISFFEGPGVERPSDLRRDGSVGLAAVEVAHRCDGVALQVRKPENTLPESKRVLF
jgi:hypothetical protein